MTENENKNGSEPAFPFEETGKSNTSFSPGLTKRELIAAMAMQGILCNFYTQKNDYDMSATDIASDAVLYADELLTQLSKPEE